MTERCAAWVAELDLIKEDARKYSDLVVVKKAMAQVEGGLAFLAALPHGDTRPQWCKGRRQDVARLRRPQL